jgi:hypothetical protein
MLTSYTVQCADSIVTILSTYQAETPGYTERTSCLLPGDSLGPALLSNDDPIAYAIEAAKIVKLCAQHQTVGAQNNTTLWNWRFTYYSALLMTS